MARRCSPRTLTRYWTQVAPEGLSEPIQEIEIFAISGYASPRGLPGGGNTPSQDINDGALAGFEPVGLQNGPLIPKHLGHANH